MAITDKIQGDTMLYFFIQYYFVVVFILNMDINS
jgi:hypothetical protein